ncbi:hypothetical protein [Vibrio vulnificus YJ016]|uniref:Uncharacterized protein n=1 Tax=Vibrio vulnificus (strain YJ016) TaxID=196600 RepID=Q7MEX4_VIBVY|nr:hypothetical protein [Vibrio vulnificus YJ016]
MDITNHKNPLISASIDKPMLKFHLQILLMYSSASVKMAV